jgi:dihydrofolate synthase/folylpolyglutamate synthase
LLDVAHNPAAAQTLANNLADRSITGRTFAVCGMFGDKDVRGVIDAVRPHIDTWIVAGVAGARALAPEALAQQIRERGGEVVHIAASVAVACEYAAAIARNGDRVVAFGSFHTVGPVLEWLGRANE